MQFNKMRGNKKMGGGEMGVEWPHPAAFRPCFSPVGLAGLSPACVRAPDLCRDGGRQKKGGVSNCFVPMLLCQRGLNSSFAVVRQRR